MIMKTRIFEFSSGYYKNLSELASAMGISVSQIYRVREGKRHINQKFIVGAVKAFPNRKLDDLFFLSPELPTVTNSHRHQHLITRSTDKAAAKEKRIMENPHQTIEKFISASEEYVQHLKRHTSTTISLREASREKKRVQS